MQGPGPYLHFFPTNKGLDIYPITPINQGQTNPGLTLQSWCFTFGEPIPGSFDLIQIAGVCRLKICENVVCTQSGLRRKAHPRPAFREFRPRRFFFRTASKIQQSDCDGQNCLHFNIQNTAGFIGSPSLNMFLAILHQQNPGAKPGHRARCRADKT